MIVSQYFPLSYMWKGGENTKKRKKQITKSWKEWIMYDIKHTIEIKNLRGDPTPDHGTQAAITNRKSISPVPSWPIKDDF